MTDFNVYATDQEDQSWLLPVRVMRGAAADDLAASGLSSGEVRQYILDVARANVGENGEVAVAITQRAGRKRDDRHFANIDKLESHLYDTVTDEQLRGTMWIFSEKAILLEGN